MSTDPLRVVFLGTPDFAAKCLEHIHCSQHEVVGVITVADKPAGRGRKLHASAVKQKAQQLNIPVLQPLRLRDKGFLLQLEDWKADVFVVVAFRMLPAAVWKMPKMGTFNLHASLLPRYRGAAPINWAVINGDRVSGASTFFIDEKIDTGNIILQQACSVESTDTAGDLYERILKLAGPLIVQTLDLIQSGDVPQREQRSSDKATEAPKLTDDNMFIDWHKTAVQIERLVRGLAPYPLARSILSASDDRPVKLGEVRVTDHELVTQLNPGEVAVYDKRVYAGTGNGVLEILHLQLPNKRMMAVKDLLNGWSFSADATFLNRTGKLSS